MYLVGQNHFKESLEKDNLDNANFYIIIGPKSYGKTYMAKYMANHYKMDYVALDNKVDTIRSLVESSRNNNNCLYHLKDFDLSSPAAKAALLKIAEETPKGIKIVVTTSAYNLLETLISRGYVIHVENYSYEEILEYSNNLNFNKELLSKMELDYFMKLTPSLLYKYKDYKDLEEVLLLVDQTIDGIITGLDISKISLIANKFWGDDGTKTKIYLDILSRAHQKLQQNRFKTAKTIQSNLYKLNKITISNYRQFIHSMLMEVVS